jgi:hypothetical protein
MCRVPRLSDQRLRFFTLTVEFCAGARGRCACDAAGDQLRRGEPAAPVDVGLGRVRRCAELFVSAEPPAS